jgi:ribosome-associated protein
MIPLAALDFATSRSGGPGGQNVNKVETKVEVRFVIANSQWLDPETQTRLLEKLANRLDRDGALRVVSSVARTQRGNRMLVVERLERILNTALVVERPRVASKPTAASRKRRIQHKRKRSEAKAARRWRPEE